MSLNAKRWLILTAGFLANMCQGIAYASSVFMVPVMSNFKISPENKAQATIVFSLIIACLPIGAIVGGLISGKKGPKMSIGIGSIIFAAGLILASFATKSLSLNMLYLTFGVMLGIGSGMAYGSIIGVVAQWFPDKRGLATGLVVAALGGGPIILAPLAEWLLKTYNLAGTYLIFGIAFAIVMIIAAFIVSTPPAGYKPEGFEPKAPIGNKSTKDFNAIEMLKAPSFWTLFFLYVSGAFSGLMIISQAKGITLDVIMKSNFAQGDYAAQLAVTGVMILAVANAFGRMFWGAISDKIGRIPVLIIMFALNCTIMAFLNIISFNFYTFMISMLVIGLCFGGYLGLFPSLCVDFFGAKNITLNYGILFAAFAVAGVAGPMAGASLEPVSAYYTAAILSLVGLATAIALSRKLKSQN